METMTSAVTIKAAKIQLRKSMAQTLSSLSKEETIRQSLLVTEKVLRSGTYAQSESISVYVNTDIGEVITDTICRSILKDGKKLYVPLFASPVVVEDSTSTAETRTTFATDMVMLRLRDLEDYLSMKLNRWGIKEPEWKHVDGTWREEALTKETGGNGLDLILAPGVAFDMEGGRLGHGKGYYDRYLNKADKFAQLHGKPGPVSVALALRQQVLAPGVKVPTDERDRMLDAIISPDVCLQSVDGKSRWIPEL